MLSVTIKSIILNVVKPSVTIKSIMASFIVVIVDTFSVIYAECHY